eukprot:CAMPEP_0172571246 /NCGR_PEP_ID=MMETSP1067-20121228/130623_1 /TAXON_ID=265564 ORGANISM="Thalassiosira punctigera, Strain Tpunct2005C2" /NCGR_SAMPLE_ID=MMETSP1067 /ASSEMBLY_ACC=CAM_ASM_000444 /LENGTH=143 /DNA_ID=CAMNT_0013363531 /DNA_START=219 /DNA_END=647 /DNA_ORIENTATION=-
MRRRLKYLLQRQVHDRHPHLSAAVPSHRRDEGDLARCVHRPNEARHVVRRRYGKIRLPPAVGAAAAGAVNAQSRERVPVLAPAVVKQEVAPEEGAAGDMQVRAPVQVSKYCVGVLVVSWRGAAKEGERVAADVGRRHWRRGCF